MDITRSGTRKEELLVPPDQLKKMYILRRILNPMGTMDAIDFLLDKLRNTKNNAEFFESMNTLGRGAGLRGRLSQQRPFCAQLHVAVYAAATLQHKIATASAAHLR